MGMKGWGNQSDPPDAEIDRDVAELRQLLARVDGPAEPHPAYWQNFVVKVRGRIEQEGGRRKRRGFAPAWASLGTAAVVTVIVVATNVFKNEPLPPPGRSLQPTPALSLAETYSSTETRSLVLSKGDVQMISAIVSDDNDAAVFEALVNAEDQ